MHIIIANVISADGRLTRGDQPGARQWASVEDRDFFRRLIDDTGVVVMGRTTYDVVHQRPRPDRLYVVLTHHPEAYADKTIAGSFEFTSAEPAELVSRLEKRGIGKLLIVGGSVVNGDFLAAGLVDELYLTVEPLIFGAGRPLAERGISEAGLRLESVRDLNDRGTLLFHYMVEPGQPRGGRQGT